MFLVKKVVVGLVLLHCLAGCQTVADSDKPDQVATQKSKEPAQLFLADLKANGDHLFCDQPAYLQCFKQTKTRCMKDLAAVKDPCLQSALQSNGGKVADSNYKKVGNDFALCMLVKHAVMYPQRADIIGHCLDGAKFENKPVTN
jgi:uncharacterized protein YceK